MDLKKDQLYPGQVVSIDHFKVTNPGRVYNQEENHIQHDVLWRL